MEYDTIEIVFVYICFNIFLEMTVLSYFGGEIFAHRARTLSLVPGQKIRGASIRFGCKKCY